MPTPMRVYAEIAFRHGIDPSSDEAIDDFYENAASMLSPEEQRKIISELLVADLPPDFSAITADADDQSPAEPSSHQKGSVEPTAIPGTTDSVKNPLLPAALRREYAQFVSAAAERLAQLSQVHFECAMEAEQRRRGLHNLAAFGMLSALVLSIVVAVLVWQGVVWSALAVALPLIANLIVPILVVRRELNFRKQPKGAKQSTSASSTAKAVR